VSGCLIQLRGTSTSLLFAGASFGRLLGSLVFDGAFQHGVRYVAVVAVCVQMGLGVVLKLVYSELYD